MPAKRDVDAGEEKCLFKLVADPCMAPVGAAPDRVMADCFQIEGVIWDDLLNENYKGLLATLDDEQTAKARAMQRAWIAYRDTTCGFYDDKIQGTMAGFMEAACVTRETARRAMLLAFFSRLLGGHPGAMAESVIDLVGRRRNRAAGGTLTH